MDKRRISQPRKARSVQHIRILSSPYGNISSPWDIHVWMGDPISRLNRILTTITALCGLEAHIPTTERKQCLTDAVSPTLYSM